MTALLHLPVHMLHAWPTYANDAWLVLAWRCRSVLGTTGTKVA